MTTAIRRSRNRGRRAEVETDLKDKYHVEFVYRSAVPIDEFDIDKSLDNQARFESLDESTAELYKEAIERGDEFPAVIAYRPGRAASAKLVIIDGNHRLVAHSRANTPIDVYEVDRATKANTIALMTYAFNTKHGKATSEEERLHAALFLIDNGATQDTAASAVNVSIALLRKALAKQKADQRADDVGLDPREWGSLTQGVRSRLLGVSTDEGFGAAVHLAYIANLDSVEIQELVADLNTNKSATRQKKLVSEQTEAYSDRIQSGGSGTFTARGKKPITPKAKLHMLMGQMANMPDDLAALAKAFQGHERETTAARLEDYIQKLHKLAMMLDPSLK